MSYNPTDALSYERLMMPLLNDPVRAIRAEAGIRLSEVPENQLSVAARKARKSALEEYSNIHLYTLPLPRRALQSWYNVCQCRRTGNGSSVVQ